MRAVSARTRSKLSARVQSAASGPRRRLPRDVRLHADGEAALSATLVTARRRPAPVRLLGGHAAATSAQRRRPRRARGDLPHALPRRPLPRPSGHAQDVRIARPRSAADDLRTARARRAAPHVAADLRSADVPRSRRSSSRRGRAGARRTTRSSPFAVDHGMTALGYAIVEDVAPGALRRRCRRWARSSRRP